MWGSGCLPSTAEALPPSQRRPFPVGGTGAGAVQAAVLPAAGRPHLAAGGAARGQNVPAGCHTAAAAAGRGAAAGAAAPRRAAPVRRPRRAVARRAQGGRCSGAACPAAQLVPVRWLGSALLKQELPSPCTCFPLWLPLPQLARRSKPCPCSSWCTLFNFVTSSGASFGLAPTASPAA